MSCRHKDEDRIEVAAGPPTIEWCRGCGSVRKGNRTWSARTEWGPWESPRVARVALVAGRALVAAIHRCEVGPVFAATGLAVDLIADGVP